MGSRALCRVGEIPDGGARGLDPDPAGNPTIFVIRRGDQLFAYRDLCPHYGNTRLAWRRDAYLAKDGTEIVCSAHGAVFRIEDGVCTRGPCQGQRLTPVTIRVVDEQIVTGA